jgi:hypothetical protein
MRIIASLAPPVKPIDIHPYFDRIQIWLKRPATAAAITKLRKACGHLFVGNRPARFDRTYRQRLSSRATGQIDCLHLEWRLKGVRAVRGAGISSGRDLPKFDHRKFWEKRLLLYGANADRIGRYFRNRSEGKKSRATGKLDGRKGQVVIDGFGTIQQLIDEYGSRFRMARVLTKISVQASTATTLLVAIPTEPPTRQPEPCRECDGESRGVCNQGNSLDEELRMNLLFSILEIVSESVEAEDREATIECFVRVCRLRMLLCISRCLMRNTDQRW